jgi:hypothetical protein
MRNPANHLGMYGMDEVKHHPSFLQEDQLAAARAEKIQQSFKHAQPPWTSHKEPPAVADSPGPV